MPDPKEWNQWPNNKPEKGRNITIIFADGRENPGYRYAGGVVFLMPPDHSTYTYATPKFWRYDDA